MHDYSINSQERVTVVGTIGIISVLLTLAIKHFVPLPSWVPLPSAFALFGLLVLVFEKFAWRWSFCIRTFVTTPDLNGKWTMLMKSSRDDYKEEYEGTLTVSQSWTKIYLFLDGEKWIGKSSLANIEINTADSYTLTWEYLSKRKPEFASQEYMHFGITKIMFEKGDEIAKGNYYADQSRHSFGPVRLIKKT